MGAHVCACVCVSATIVCTHVPETCTVSRFLVSHSGTDPAALDEARQARADRDQQVIVASEAKEAASKAEADLQALSESYNTLESEMEDLLVCLGVEVRMPEHLP